MNFDTAYRIVGTIHRTSSTLECNLGTHISLRCTVLMTHHSPCTFGTVTPASIGHMDVACVLEEEAEAAIVATIGATHCGVIIIPLSLCACRGRGVWVCE